MAKQLTLEQERIVLKSLIGRDYMACGSSRIVYECDEEIKEYLGLNHEHNYVIKLACGQGGMNQSNAELSAFLDYGRQYLAEVFYFGQFVLISEGVDTDDWIDFAEGIYGDASDDELVDYVNNYLYDEYYWVKDNERPDYFDSFYNAAQTIRCLAEIFGRTADNGQLGTGWDGRLVAYDYGFIAGKGCDTQCSNQLVDNILGDDDRFYDYIDELIQVLDELKETYMKLDEIIYRTTAIEEHINNVADFEWRNRRRHDESCRSDC